MHLFKHAGVLCAGGQEIDSGGIDGAVPQDVGKLDDVPADLIKGAREQMAQIMWKYFGGCDACCLAEPFHLCPDLPSGQAFAAFGEKDLT